MRPVSMKATGVADFVRALAIAGTIAGLGMIAGRVRRHRNDQRPIDHRQHQHDRTRGDRKRKRDVPIGKSQIWRDVLHLRIHYRPQNTQQQRDREGEHGK